MEISCVEEGSFIVDDTRLESERGRRPDAAAPRAAVCKPGLTMVSPLVKGTPD